MEAVILTIVFLALAGLGIAYWWFHADHVGKRRLKSVPRTPIAEAAEGQLVKVTGTLVVADQPGLEAPVTGRSCVGYVIEIKERMQSGATANWETLVTKEDAVVFLVEDDTGRAFVKAEGAHLVLVRDGHVQSGLLSDHSERAKAFFAEQGTESQQALWKKKAVRFEEGVLEPGEEVSVLGVAAWEDVPEAMRGETNAARWLTLTAPPDAILTISDDPATL